MAILRPLDPAPVFQRKAENSRSRGYVGTVLYYVRQLLLWHSPESLEEPGSGGGGRTMGSKLKNVVAKLEKARELAWNDDAVFLLAEMNLVSSRAGDREESKRD